MSDETKRCPFCDEEIRVAAIRCRHCNMMLDGSAPAGTPAPSGATPYPAGATPAPGAPAGWWQVAGPLSAGTVVREYRIERMLGEGGMGEVYLAEQTTTGRAVAMKVVAPELMRDEGVRRRFVEEARVMADLDHANIVTLYTFFEEGGRFFLVMKFIDGESLDDRIERAGPLTVDEAVRVSTAVLAALEYAHTRPQPVIHRDIKPANILLGKDGSVVVMDFGIAKAMGREKLTRTAGVVGTYEYMSPEQIMGSEVSPATDVYCFGITLYKMLTGVVPFPQKTDTGMDCVDGHRHKAVLPLAEFRDGLPDWLQTVVEKALAKQTAARFPSASAMSKAMEKASSRPAAPPLPAPAPPRPASTAPSPPRPTPPPQPRPARQAVPSLPLPEPDADGGTPLPAGRSGGLETLITVGMAVALVAVLVVAISISGGRKEKEAEANSGTTWADAASGLTWQNPPAERTMDWETARNYCNDLSLGGHTDWHLPTIGELRSLIRGCSKTEAGGGCNIKEGQCVKWSCRTGSCNGCSGKKGQTDGCYWPDEMEGRCTWYWSSSPVEDFGDRAWYVYFNGGRVYNRGVYYDGDVRCVR